MILKKKTTNINFTVYWQLLHAEVVAPRCLHYINNPIYQELTEQDKYTANERDDHIYIDMRRSKGYTDELKKINRDDSQLALTIDLKAAVN